MNHQPTQLALLISLIGVGVSPYANASARLEGRVVGAVQSLPGVSCDELETAAVHTCAGPADLVWQPTRTALGLPASAGVRVLYTAPRDDWAPGELAGAPDESPGRWVPRQQADLAQPTSVQAAPNPAEARDPPRSGSRKQATAKARKVRVIAEAPSAARVNAQPLARADLAIERLSQIERIDGPQAAATAAAPLAAGAPASGPDKASRPRAQALVPEAEPQQAERPAVATATQANVVLRNLGAILSEERDEVGAIRPDAPAGAATSQASKVMSMLGEIAGAQPAVEDGPARRLRKLAAREAAELVAEVARNGVDLMLPLETPTVADPQPTDRTDTRPLIESLPVAVQPAGHSVQPTPQPMVQPTTRQARTNPFGDRQVAVSETALDRVRGGFSSAGLNISFGIERATYINGALVTTTSLNVSDLGRITAGAAASFNVGSIGLIQSGAGNVISPTMISAGSVGTVIQNTLDGQKIQNVTIINATTNSLGLLKGMNMQSSLRGAVIDSLRR